MFWPVFDPDSDSNPGFEYGFDSGFESGFESGRTGSETYSRPDPDPKFLFRIRNTDLMHMLIAAGSLRKMLL